MTTANFDEVRAHLERLQTTVDALADGVLPLASGPQAVAFHAIHHHFNFADDGLYCVAATVPGAGRIAAETSAVAQLVGKVCQIVSAELGTIINNCRRAIYHLYMQNLRFHHMHIHNQLDCLELGQKIMATLYAYRSVARAIPQVGLVAGIQ